MASARRPRSRSSPESNRGKVSRPSSKPAGPPAGKLSPPKDAPDLVFALIGPSGCDLDGVTEALETELRTVQYRLVDAIRLSELLTALPVYDASKVGKASGMADEAARITELQNAGDKVREACNDASA